MLLSVVGDYVHVPGPWQADPGGPPEHGVPTSFHASRAAGEAPYGRLLSGIRGLRLQVTGGRVQFTYADKRSAEVRGRIAVALAERDGVRDAAARKRLLRGRET